MTATLPHIELVRRAQAADPEALGAIYERYSPAIYRYIYFRTGDAELARDVHSDVFVRMLEGIERYEDRGWSISAWLYRIAHDRTIDALRRKDRHVHVTLEPWDLVMEGPDEEVTERILRQTLRRAFHRLSENQRRVLILRFVYRLSLEETARQMGRSLGAIKALQHRAIDHLRRLVLEEFGEQ